MAFQVIAEVDDRGQLVYRVEVPDGGTVFWKDVARVLALMLFRATAAPDQRLNTLSEQKAWEEARRLPTGWNPTEDGVSTSNDITRNVTLVTRIYGRNDGAIATAPCASDGSAVPETRDALIAYDVANPPANAMEA